MAPKQGSSSGASSSRAARSSSGGAPDLEPAEEYAQLWGDPGTRRGIRGGGAAKRKRAAFVRHQAEQLGIDPSEVPVVHQGGLARPLGTSRLWSPSPSRAAEAAVDQEVDQVEAEEVVVEASSEEDTPVVLTQSVSPVDLRPRPAIPRARKADPEFGRLRVKAPPPVRTVRHTSEHRGLPRPPVASVEPVRPAAPEPVQYLQSVDLPGVRVWSVSDSFVPTEIRLDQVPVIPSNGRLVAIDWHQVSDVFRFSARRNIQASDSGQVPADVVAFYGKVKRRIGAQDKFCIISHIERSEGNLQRILRSVRTSRLPVSYIFVTTARTGPGGKTEVAQNLLHSLDLTGKACLLDDNLSVGEEFVESGGTLYHVKKPSLRGQVPRQCSTHPDKCQSAWNILQHLQALNLFLASGRGRRS